MTGPRADTHCSAQAGSSHCMLPTGSESDNLCLVPCPDHPHPPAPMGAAAPPRPSCPADLHPCPLCPATSTPQVGQHLCHFNIGTGHPLPKRAALLPATTGGRWFPGPQGKSLSIQQWPTAQETALNRHWKAALATAAG
jgi:hypothetical protein